MEAGSIRERMSKGDLFAQIISHLPYPVAVFSYDGTMRTTNFALLAEMNLGSDDIIMKTLNGH